MLCFFVNLCFFFFKQKTAYEMRISDWSSDVCSSDLLGPHALAAVAGDPYAVQTQHPLDLLRQARFGVAMDGAHQVGVVDDRLRQVDVAQIGRATCRERVCQYV